MEKADIKDIILETMTVSLEAQLRALKRLRSPEAEPEPAGKRMSQVEMVHDILLRAGKPLHVNEIIAKVEEIHKVKLERESIVSALAKKVARKDRFIRTDKNTFGLLTKEGGR